MRHRGRAGLAPTLLLLIACGSSAEHPPGATSGSGASGASGSGSGSGAGPSSGGVTTGSGGASSGGSSSGSATGGASPCEGSADSDVDGDGFTPNQGDCNDCDAGVGPGAYDIISVDDLGRPVAAQLDEDCDGTITMPGMEPSCDDGLLVDDADPIVAARALDICRLGSDGGWGLLAASYVQLDGTPLPDPVGHGILAAFGSNVGPQRGARMVALSSGTARQPGDVDYLPVAGHDKAYGCEYPPGYPLVWPACGEVEVGPPRDAAALRVELRVPTNVDAFSFLARFYTAAYPERVCTSASDLFITLMDPPPMGAVWGDIVFDNDNNPISVNSTVFDACVPGLHGGKTFTCPLGVADLAGTGFDQGAATSWLKATAPTVPGTIMVLTFAIADADDGLHDSTVILDDFRFFPNVTIPI